MAPYLTNLQKIGGLVTLIFTVWKFTQFMLSRKYKNYLGELVNKRDGLPEKKYSNSCKWCLYKYTPQLLCIFKKNRKGEQRMGKRISNLRLYW